MSTYRKRSRTFWIAVLGVLLGSVLAVSLACATAEPTATPAAPMQPDLPDAPTVMPQPTATLVPGAPTPIPARPTPTRVLPTATPVSMMMEGPQKGGTAIVAREVDGWTMDPTFSLQWSSLFWMYSIYNNLVINTPNAEITPDLAERWSFSDDGRVITMNLRRGVKFHDGTDVNADAVKFTIDRYMMETVPPDDRPSLRRSQFAPVQSFEKVDDYTVRFTLNEPLRPFLAQLTQRPGMILSPTAVQADPQDFERNPVGSGPFIISRWQHNANIELTRNPDYWNPDEPHLDAVRVFHTVDPTVELAMIRTGEVDFAESIRQADVTLVQDRSDLVLEENFGGRYEIIIFRLGDGPPWDNRNFRRALAYATDREELVETQWEGHGAPAYIPIGPAFGVWHNPDMQPLKYDLQAAKNELAQAGYPNGIDIPLPCPATTERLQHCEVLRELWAPAGINATIDSRPASGHWGSWVQGDFSMIVSWRAARPDPHINIQRVFHSQGFSNPMRYNNPQVDVLIDQAGAEYDVSAAKLLYDQVQDLVVNDAVEIYQAYPSEYHVRKQELKGYGFYLNGAFRFRDWWLER